MADACFLPGMEPPPVVGAAPDGASDEWYTPGWLLAWLPRIGLDPCFAPDSSVDAAGSIDVRQGRDGLTSAWDCSEGIVYCNPPYSTCAAWVQKCRRESERGQLVVALIPARAGEVYWHEHVWPHATVGFVRGRIAFDTQQGPGTGPGTFSSALVVWGPPEAAAWVVGYIAEKAARHPQRPVWVRAAG